MSERWGGPRWTTVIEAPLRLVDESINVKEARMRLVFLRRTLRSALAVVKLHLCSLAR